MLWVRQLLAGLLLQMSIFDHMGYEAKWEGVGFSPSTLVFPCQYHPIIVSYSCSSSDYSYQNDKHAKPVNFPTKQHSSGNQGPL
jgi:hypothetical protein